MKTRDEKIASILDTRFLAEAKRSRFSGRFTVEWKDGLIKSADLSTTLRFSCREKSELPWFLFDDDEE